MWGKNGGRNWKGPSTTGKPESQKSGKAMKKADISTTRVAEAWIGEYKAEAWIREDKAQSTVLMHPVTMRESLVIRRQNKKPGPSPRKSNYNVSKKNA